MTADVMKADKTTEKSKERREKEHSPTKVIIRRLPPNLTSEEFLEQISPVPDHTYYSYCKADKSLGSHAFCRAYLNFVNFKDIYLFREKFDNYVFIDSSGNECPAIVEFSPFQKIPIKPKKVDLKKGTIEEDADYKSFLVALAAEPEAAPTTQSIIEEIEARERDLKGKERTTTPLLDYIKKRKEERRLAVMRNREERQRRDLERKKAREEERKKRVERERKDRDREQQRKKERDRAKNKDKEDEENDKKNDQPLKVLKKDADNEKGRRPFTGDSKIKDKKYVKDGDRAKDRYDRNYKDRDTRKDREDSYKDRSDGRKDREDRGRRDFDKQEGKNTSTKPESGKELKPRFGKEEREKTRLERQEKDRQKSAIKGSTTFNNKDSRDKRMSSPVKDKEKYKTDQGEYNRTDKAQKDRSMKSGKDIPAEKEKRDSVTKGGERGDGTVNDRNLERSQKKASHTNECSSNSANGSGDQFDKIEKKTDKSDRRTRYKDRPEKEIYVPGKRAAERKLKEQDKKTPARGSSEDK